MQSEKVSLLQSLQPRVCPGGVCKANGGAGHLWLTPVIPATWKAEIRRISVGSHPRQIVLKTLSQKKTHHKTGLVERSSCRAPAWQVCSPEFKLQCYQKKKKLMVGADFYFTLHTLIFILNLLF
jgi:hypothetical protein